MTRKIKGLNVILGGALFFIIGVLLIVCTLPIFTHTRQILVEVPRSETVVDSPFDIYKSQDKTIQFQISIGESLGIYVTRSENMSFSIANFTSTDIPIQPDKPDIVYFSQNGSSPINVTWAPPNRVPEPGKYYLVFLARNASSDSPVHVYANATKTWTDYRLKDVVAEDRIPLLDQSFVYVGSAMAVLGAALFSVTLSRSHRLKNRK